jgi:diguanylate cyclase (GGDEF)-like protein/PAS domain S-box-containing protein
LGEAVQQMAEGGESSLIVIADGQIVGIVTEGDILHAMRQQRDKSLAVAHIMTSPVHCVPADMPFRTAYRDAARHGIRHIVVSDDQGRACGVVSESDFRKYLGSDFFRHLNDVDALMDRMFPRLAPDAPLSAALTAMEAARASCVVILQGRRPVGILTERDVVRLFAHVKGDPPLSAVMTAPALSIAQDATLAQAADEMNRRGIRHLVAVDREGNAVGLLSEHALMRPLEMDLVDDALLDRIALINPQDSRLAQTLRNEHYQRALLDNFPFLVWLKDTDSRFLAVNQPLARLAGVADSKALIGKSDFDLWPRHLAERYQADDQAVMQSHSPLNIVEQGGSNGQLRWFETYKAPVIDDHGQLMGTVGFARDVSERKNAEEATILRNAALAGLIRGEPIQGILELIALSIEVELRDWSCAILISDRQRGTLTNAAAPRLSAAYLAAIEDMPIGEGIGTCGTAAFRRERVITPDVFASPFWQDYLDLAHLGGFAACFSEPILGPGQQLLGTLAAYHATPASPSKEQIDLLVQGSQLAALVIAHARNLRDLQASQKTFHGIFEGAAQAFLILDEQGRIIEANSEALRLSAYPRQELLGQHYRSLISSEINDLADVDRKINSARAEQAEIFELWLRDAHGRLFPAETHVRTGRYFGQQALIASLQDISERKLSELQRHIEHALAQQLLNETPVEALLEHILHAFLRYPAFNAGTVHWPGAEGRYTLIAHAGLAAESLANVRDITGDNPLLAVIEQGQARCSCHHRGAHCSDDPLADHPLLKAGDLASLLVLPLAIDEHSRACLTLGSRINTHLSDATVAAMENLAQHLANSLHDHQIRASIRQTQHNLSGLFESLNDFIVIVDTQGRIIDHNHAVNNLGYPKNSLIGQPISCLHPLERQGAVESTLESMLNGSCNRCSEPLICADGRQISVETRCTSGQWNGQPAIFGISQDISARLNAEEKQRLATSVFDNAHEGIMITDAQGRIIEINGTFTELTGYSRDEAIGHNADLLNSGHHNADFYREMWQTIQSQSYWRGEVWNRKKNGEIFVELLTISTVRDDAGAITHYVGIFSDITLQKENQQRLEHLAHYDALTQLPNRMLLGDRMQLAMAQCERNHKLLAICYLDLDGFKPINDQFGHSTGDCLLIEVGQRLKACVRAGDTVSRLGGDEFVLLFSGLANEHECDQAVNRVLVALNQTFLIGGRHLAISASIGVTLYPTDGSDADTLLRHADQAMYIAKQGGRNRSHLFDPESDRRARARRDETSRILSALNAGEFELHYQPKVNMRQGNVIGAEALIRWRHPERGLLLPGDFLPIVAGTPLAIDIGDWVLQEALRQMAAWRAEGLDIQVSVNIAGEHLLQPWFVSRLRELCAAFPSVQPSQIELEILETAALEDMQAVAQLFAECRSLGVHFALDDFGTGYSSLTYFRRLPADILKIDQSFVRDMLDDSEDLAIVEGVISLTQAFQRQVIAEGVETVEHGLILLLLGCDLAQGYGIARPMPASELPAWIEGFQPDSLWSTATAFDWSRDDLPLLIAEVDHKRWLQQFHDHINQRPFNGTVPELPPLDPHSCRFGQWYHGRASQRYRNMPAFIALADAHQQLHDAAGQLSEIRETAQTERQALAERLQAASQDMMKLLQDIQAEIILSTPRTHSNKRQQ